MSAIPVLHPELVARVPPGFLPADLRVRTGDWVVRSLPFAEEAASPVAIWEIRKGRTHLRAKTAISVRMWSEEAFIFAENESLRVLGHGRDIESALADFNAHVVYFHKYYSNLREDQVMGEGLRLKRLFESMFERVS